MKKNFLIILLFACFSAHAQSDTTSFQFTVKLLKVATPPPHCGIMTWALTQKFEIQESAFPFMKKGYPVLLNQPCPELLGKDFFLPGQVYKVRVSQKSASSIDHTVVNTYEKNDLPTFWIQSIEPVTSLIQ